MTYFKKDHLFKFSYWIVPVHLGAHWAMMVNILACSMTVYQLRSVCMTLYILVKVLARVLYRI